MNASGLIEHGIESVNKHEFLPRTTGAPPPASVSRYRRLAESRSITPSPTPLLSEGERDPDGGFKVIEFNL